MLSSKKNDLFPYLLLAPAFLFISVFLIYPLVKAIIISFFDDSLVRASHGFQFFGNFAQVMKGGDLGPAFRNTLKWVAGCVTGQALLGTAAALLLNENFKGRTLMRTLIIIPWVIPGVASGLAWKWLFNMDFGFVNHYLRVFGIIGENINWLANERTAMISCIACGIWLGFPFWTIMILAKLQGIPESQTEAARIDGANYLQIVYHIMLPNLSSLLMVLAILGFVRTFNTFEVIYLMTGGGPGGATEIFPLKIYYMAFEGYELSRASAMGVFNLLTMTAVIAAYFFVLSRVKTKKGER